MGRWCFEKKISKKLLDYFKSKILNEYVINAFNINELTLPNVYDFIIKKDPVIIKGYLSSLLLLAKYMRQNNFKPNLNLKCISCTTETILPPYRNLIEEVFNAPLYDQYGCGEVSAISYECSKRNMHINSEHVFLEILNNKNIPVSNINGHITVTSLDNFIMPFIRYQNGDESQLFSKSCDCELPFPIMDHISGRSIDNIKLNDGSNVHGVFFTTLFYENNFTVNEIEKFQIVQHSDYSVTVFLQSQFFSKDNTENIQKIVSQFVNVRDVQVLKLIPLENNGKFRYIKGMF
jgi:phenylacetate-CoA ligase